MDWRELGGPSFATPPAEGFGLSLITRSIGHELDGVTRFDFASDGFRVRVEAPLEHLIFREEQAHAG